VEKNEKKTDIERKTKKLKYIFFFSYHVVDDVGLGDLLGPKRLRRRQVHAVVVSQVVVGNDGRRLDPGADQEVDQHRLHLRLARLEVVAADQDAPLDGELQEPRDERVLRGTVDEGDIF